MMEEVQRCGRNKMKISKMNKFCSPFSFVCLFFPYFQCFNKSTDLLLNDKVSVCLSVGITVTIGRVHDVDPPKV